MHEYMTRRMISRQAMTYADRALAAGDQFLATPDDAGYLARTGRAVDAPPEPAAVIAPPAPVVETVAPEAPAADPAPAAPARRAYVRRTVQAEPGADNS